MGTHFQLVLFSTFYCNTLKQINKLKISTEKAVNYSPEDACKQLRGTFQGQIDLSELRARLEPGALSRLP
jgi:hypothetical protein